MDMNVFLLAFIGAVTVFTMVALFDLRRRSGCDRYFARWDWVLVLWLAFVAVAVVVAADEVNQRTYNVIEWAIMVFGAFLLVGLTALIVYIWWQIAK